MNFPQFWAKATCDGFSCWGSSSQSLAAAQASASKAAQQLADRFRVELTSAKRGGYYPDRPFREQVLQEFRDDAGQLSAVVTRNSYGCLVLNTARIMFVDIDLPDSSPSRGLFATLFGLKQQPAGDGLLKNALGKIETWTANNPRWGWRVYRTRAGLRLLATQEVMGPEDPKVDRAFDQLGADPLYRKLCFSQKCYRARLTPKPWRCGVHAKPERWPWPDEKRQQRFEKWDANYRSKSKDWATCAFLQHVGNPTIHPEVQSILKFHDDAARVGSNLQLA